MTDELLEQLQQQRRELRGMVLRLNRLSVFALDQVALIDAMLDQAQALAVLNADQASEGAPRHAARS